MAIGGRKEKLYILRKSTFNGQGPIFSIIANDEKKHYAVIKILSRLLGSSNSSNEHRQHICLNCLQGLHSEASRDKYYVYNEAVHMPKENSFMRFHHGQYQSKVLFAIYADFKAIFQEETEIYGSPISEDSYCNKSTAAFPLDSVLILHVLTERFRIL